MPKLASGLLRVPDLVYQVDYWFYHIDRPELPGGTTFVAVTLSSLYDRTRMPRGSWRPTRTTSRSAHQPFVRYLCKEAVVGLLAIQRKPTRVRGIRRPYTSRSIRTMKFVSTPLIFAILAAGTTVDAGLFSPIKNGISQTLQQPGWMLASMMRGGSMGKLLVMLLAAI